MEPGHEDREDRTCEPRSCSTGPCRNGARSRRPGRLERRGPRHHAEVAAMEPGHEDREDPRMHGMWTLGRRAAMEPGHEDREDGRSRRRSSAQPGGRNGARSRRPGRPRLTAPPEPPKDSRNGARSRRPGRLNGEVVGELVTDEPQWSPVTKTGKTCLLYTSPSPRDGLLSRMP